MAFKEIQQGARQRLTVIEKASTFTQVVMRVLSSLYPKERKAVRQVIYDPTKKGVSIYASTQTAANRFSAEKSTIHAALRREGLDVKKVSIR